MEKAYLEEYASILIPGAFWSPPHPPWAENLSQRSFQGEMISRRIGNQEQRSGEALCGLGDLRHGDRRQFSPN